MSKLYPIQMEVAADFAMFAAIADSGSEQSTSLVPSGSAIKGMIENVLFIRHAEIIPAKIHICRPIQLIYTGFNYDGPLRKDNGTIQYRVSMLSDVVYQIFAYVRNAKEETAKYATVGSQPYLHKINHAHSYQEQFIRHVRQGRTRRPVVLGRSTCLATYVGPFREGTVPCESVNMEIPLLLKSPFTKPMFGQVDFTKISVYRNLVVKNGVMQYA